VRFHECFSATGGGTLEVSLQGDNAWFLTFFKYVVMLLDCCFIVLVVDVTLVML
jgi:hypothetical protein